MISAIVAVDKEFGIGYKNKLLESVPEDLKRFKELTTDKVVIMGRKTWESLPKRPLPNRHNIVITSIPPKNADKYENVEFCSMPEAIIYLLSTEDDVFIMGGGKVYSHLLAYCDKIYLTLLDKEYEKVDTYFPNFASSGNWALTKVSDTKTYNDISYQFQEYSRTMGTCLEKCKIDKN